MHKDSIPRISRENSSLSSQERVSNWYLASSELRWPGVARSYRLVRCPNTIGHNSVAPTMHRSHTHPSQSHTPYARLRQLYISHIHPTPDFAVQGCYNYLKYLNDIFTLFKSRDIILSPAKSFIRYPLIELLGFYINTFGLSLTI